MSITTKKGDKGITSLYYGGMVSKDDARVDACGTLDELCSFLGLSKVILKDQKGKKIIESIQQDLFAIGAELATKGKFLAKLQKRIDKSCITRLEQCISDLEKKRKLKKRYFCLPGENPISAVLDISRTVARRAERISVTLKRKGKLSNDFILIYLNRLSDLLYLMARACEKNHPKLKSR